MTDDELTALLNTRGSPALESIGGRVTGFTQAGNEVEMDFEAKPWMCHSRVIVQGGFITAMVDSAMAYAAMGATRGQAAVPTLEVKVSFLRAGNPGPMNAIARAIRMGRSVGFLEGELFQDGERIATASSTIRILYKN